MSKKLARKHQEDYDSDGGFVEDAPKKKLKGEPKERSNGAQTDDEGNEYWALTDKRRVQVSEFKGNTMIGIREFYESNGKMLPGKKGISLPIDQYKTLLELIPDIEKALRSKGVNVPRPQFDKSSAPEEDEGEDPDDEEKESGHSEGRDPSKVKVEKDKKKRNHDVTSDEEDD